MMKLSMNEVRPCLCGSGKDSHWQNDARGIPLCRTCSDCHQTKMAGYRASVLNDPDYACDETHSCRSYFIERSQTESEVIP
jgi:hypothetical protein